MQKTSSSESWTMGLAKSLARTLDMLLLSRWTQRLLFATGLLLGLWLWSTWQIHQCQKDIGNTVNFSVRDRHIKFDPDDPKSETTDGYRAFVRFFNIHNGIRTTFSGYMCPRDTTAAEIEIYEQKDFSRVAAAKSIALHRIIKMEYKRENENSTHFLWAIEYLDSTNTNNTRLFWIKKNAFRVLVDLPTLPDSLATVTKGKSSDTPHAFDLPQINAANRLRRIALDPPAYCDILFHDVFGINGITISKNPKMHLQPASDASSHEILYVLEYNGDFYSYAVDDTLSKRDNLSKDQFSSFEAQRLTPDPTGNNRWPAYGWQGLDTGPGETAAGTGGFIAANATQRKLIQFSRNPLNGESLSQISMGSEEDWTWIQAPAVTRSLDGKIFLFSTAVGQKILVHTMNTLESAGKITATDSLPLPGANAGQSTLAVLVRRLSGYLAHDENKPFYIEGIAATAPPNGRLFICARDGRIFYLDNFETLLSTSNKPVWHLFDRMSKVPGTFGQDLAFDHKGDIWFATNFQIIRLGKSLFTRQYRLAEKFIDHNNLFYYLAAAFLITSVLRSYSKQKHLYSLSLLSTNEELAKRGKELVTANTAIASEKDKLEAMNRELQTSKEKLAASNMALTGEQQKLQTKNLELERSQAELASVNKKLELNRDKLVARNRDLSAARKKLTRAKNELEEKNLELVKRHIENIKYENRNIPHLIGSSPQMLEIARKIEIFANHINHDKNILITGERGSGKTLIARLIHQVQYQDTKAFREINAALMKGTVYVSELFGYVEGAFTGALKGGRWGAAYYADNGTIFFDEIDRWPLEIQGELLSFFQSRQYTRLGDLNTIHHCNARFIFASNKNLEDLVERGEFDPSLYDRIKQLHFRISPLRERKEDIRPLVAYFLEQEGKNREIQYQIESGAMELLVNREWKGNIRELQNAVGMLVVYLGENSCITTQHVLEHMGVQAQTKDDWHFEQDTPLKIRVAKFVLHQFDFIRSNSKSEAEAGRLLGLKAQTVNKMIPRLRDQIKKYEAGRANNHKPEASPQVH